MGLAKKRLTTVYISAVAAKLVTQQLLASKIELAQCCRNRAELKAVQKAFKSNGTDVLPITQSISDLAKRIGF